MLLDTAKTLPILRLLDAFYFFDKDRSPNLLDDSKQQFENSKVRQRLITDPYKDHAKVSEENTTIR